VPLAPAVIVIHPTLLAAVQPQLPPFVVTVTVPEVALADTVALSGEIAYVQAMPSCVTVNVCPAIVKVPVRSVVEGLAATL